MPAVLTNSGMARHQHIDALVLGEFDMVHHSWRRRMGPGWLWDTVALIKASFASSLAQSAISILGSGVSRYFLYWVQVHDQLMMSIAQVDA